MSQSFKPEDIMVTSFSSKSDSRIMGREQGIRVTHLPTGKVVTCEEHRSPHRNRAACFEMLEEYIKGVYQSVSPTVDQQDKYLSRLLELSKDYGFGKAIRLPEQVTDVASFTEWLEREV